MRLATVASGSQWPGISWDGDGKPLKGSWTTNWTGEPGKLTMWGHIDGPTAPTAMMENGRLGGEFNKDKPSQWYRQITSETKAVQVRVGVDEFANAGSLELHKPIAVGPLKVQLRTLTKSSDGWQCKVDITGAAKDRLGYAIAPVVVTRSGLRVGPESNSSEHPYFVDPDSTAFRDMEAIDLQFIRRAPAPFNQDEFDHLELLWRKVEIVTFEDFAAAPAGGDGRPRAGGA